MSRPRFAHRLDADRVLVGITHPWSDAFAPGDPLAVLAKVVPAAATGLALTAPAVSFQDEQLLALCDGAASSLHVSAAHPDGVVSHDLACEPGRPLMLELASGALAVDLTACSPNGRGPTVIVRAKLPIDDPTWVGRGDWWLLRAAGRTRFEAVERLDPYAAWAARPRQVVAVTVGLTERHVTHVFRRTSEGWVGWRDGCVVRFPESTRTWLPTLPLDAQSYLSRLAARLAPHLGDSMLAAERALRDPETTARQLLVAELVARAGGVAPPGDWLGDLSDLRATLTRLLGEDTLRRSERLRFDPTRLSVVAVRARPGQPC